MTDAAIPQKEKRKIKYEFTPIEILELSHQLANKTKEFVSITDEKKTVMSQYAARLNEVKATQNILSNQVADGYELRDLEFVIEWHKPEQNMKTLTPTTEGECIIEKMTQWDHNLFNQYNSKVDPDEKKALDDRQSQEAKTNDNPFPWDGEDKEESGTIPTSPSFRLDSPEAADPVFIAQEDMRAKKLSQVHIPEADPEAMKRVAEDGVYSTDTGKKKLKVEKKADKKAKSPFKADHPDQADGFQVGEQLEKERDKLRGKKK